LAVGLWLVLGTEGCGCGYGIGRMERNGHGFRTTGVSWRGAYLSTLAVYGFFARRDEWDTKMRIWPYPVYLLALYALLGFSFLSFHLSSRAMIGWYGYDGMGCTGSGLCTFCYFVYD